MFYTKQISEMKGAVQSYTSALESLLRMTGEARAVYNETALLQYTKEQRENLNEARGAAIDRISAAADDLKEVINKVWTPNENNYNAQYMTMLEAVPMTLQEIEKTAQERFSDNPTMLMALRAYAERKGYAKGGVFAPDSPLRYASKDIMLSEVDNLVGELRGVLAWDDEAHAQSLRYAVEHFEDAFATVKPFIKPQ